MRRVARGTTRRVLGVAGASVLTAVLVAGCGGSPYCDTVEKNRETLDRFGAERTDAAFARYASAMTAIAKQAPVDSSDDWTTLARATQGVITAHRDVGFKLADMRDETKRESLSDGDIAALNAAYEKFNDTGAARKAIVADVAETCDIELK